ncbi:terminase large subunit [Flagellimonas sp. S174]|uniref:terminase large subunit n=1 Tax=Flagellimonas sp. S174 TaxID=3410790 RepID=UPI003BF477C5
MDITQEMRSSVPFQYAHSVLDGTVPAGKRVVQACERFFKWIDTAKEDGYSIDHQKGMAIIRFFPLLLNHTKGKLAGQPFHLAPFQQFTLYNVFGWVDKDGKRRISTVYDKRAKKNGKSAEMAGLSLFMMSFEMEPEAEVYVGATKEEQAKICWNAAKSFIESPHANPAMKKLRFYCKQKEILNTNTNSVLKPLGGDSKTQDGINSYLSIIDEYHAHATDGVKENLESSSVQRVQPITWHITTAGTNIASVCKAYEDTCIEVLDGIKKDDHLWIMIHDLDNDDDWEDESNWYKANPLLGQGLDIESLRKEFIKAQNQPSKAPNFKTKHLNKWVDAPTIWIPQEIWDKNKVDSIPIEKFKKYGSYAAVDLSSTTDLTAEIHLSEPDDKGNRYLLPFFFCPLATIERRSKEDRVPYRAWMDKGLLIATPGDTVDYDVLEDNLAKNYHELSTLCIEFDKWNASQVMNNLMEKGFEVSEFSQSIANISFPTKQFEKLVYDGKIKHDGNIILKWMLSGCVIYEDANENIKVHKGRSHMGNKRVDGIVGSIMALGGSLTGEETNESKYNDMDIEEYLEPTENE